MVSQEQWGGIGAAVVGFLIVFLRRFIFLGTDWDAHHTGSNLADPARSSMDRANERLIVAIGGALVVLGLLLIFSVIPTHQ